MTQTSTPPLDYIGEAAQKHDIFERSERYAFQRHQPRRFTPCGVSSFGPIVIAAYVPSYGKG